MGSGGGGSGGGGQAAGNAFQQHFDVSTENIERAAEGGISGLSAPELQAIEEYTASGYFELNEQLRDGSLDGKNETLANVLDSALDKLPNHVGESTRNMVMEDAAAEAFLSNHVPGENVSYENFLSTSTDDRVSSGFARDGVRDGMSRIEFKIEGKTGKDISNFSGIAEQEILFSRNTNFRVGSISKERFSVQMPRNGGTKSGTKTVVRLTEI